MLSSTQLQDVELLPTTARAIVAELIAAHKGVSHLRFEIHGGFGTRTTISVKTVGTPGINRPRGTQEQQYLAVRESDDSSWADILDVLDDTEYQPTLTRSAGCDIAADGSISNRRGTAQEAANVQRRWESQLRRRAQHSIAA